MSLHMKSHRNIYLVIVWDNESKEFNKKKMYVLPDSKEKR